MGSSIRPATTTGPSIVIPGSSEIKQSPHMATSQTPVRETNRPIDVSDKTFEAQVLRSSQPVLVDFWAPWCGPCKMVSPAVEEIGRQHAGHLKVAKVNTDENPAYASRLGIQGIPTLILFRNGREVDRIVGAAPKQALQSWIDQKLSE